MKPQLCQPNYPKYRKYSAMGYKTQPIKKFNPRRRKFYKNNDQPASPMNTTQFILNSQGFYENPGFEGFEVNNFNFETNYGSMLGLINEECLNRKPEERAKKEDGNEIDVILRLSRQESDPTVLMDSIEKLAKIIKEKQERIDVLEKSVKEDLREEGKNQME